MSGIKLPITLLFIVIIASVFLLDPFSSRPTHDQKPTDKQTPAVAKSAKDRIAEAKNAFKQKDFQKTVSLLAQFRNEKNYEIQRMLGYSYAGLKMFDPAIVAFEKSLEMRKVPENGFSLAYLYEITGRLKVARLLYEDVLRADLPPKMRRAVYEGLSRTSVYENNTKAAFKYNMEMVKKYPDSPEGFVALIKIIRNTGLLKGLDNLVARGDKFHGKNFEYNFWLGVLYFEVGKLDRALERFKTCISVSPDNSTPYYYTYRIKKKKKNLKQVFGDAYKEYCKKTWRLIPYVF